MKITYHPQTKTFVAEAKYHEKDILKGNGFQWNGTMKAWTTDDKEKALRLRHKFDEVAKAAVEIDEKKQEESRASSGGDKPVNENYYVPVPAGKTMRPYQIAGVEFIMARKNTLLADQMGVGKTCTAIGAINKTENPRRVLVVCPASLKLNWLKELKMWLVNPATIKVLYSKGQHLVEDINGGKEGGLEVVVVNYDILDRFDLTENWDIMILDECHVLKNKSAKRTVAVFGGGKSRKKAIPASKIIGLTGTPVQNRPSELWSILRGLDGERWTSSLWQKFHVRYCAAVNTRFGWDTSGASNLDELNKLLRGTIMMRRTKSQVLKEMPAKSRKTTELETTKEIRKLLATEEALQYIVDVGVRNADPAKLAAIQEYLDDRTEIDSDKEKTVIGELAKVRRMVGEIKAPLVAEYVEELLEGGQEKVVVFAHHKTVVNILQVALHKYGVVKLVGDTPDKVRQQSVDLFQGEGGPRVFIGSIQAAGVGITLVRSSYSVFAEVDWVPGNLEQAEDRTHRIGQNEAVTIDYVIFAGSCDTVMIDAVESKKEVISEIQK